MKFEKNIQICIFVLILGIGYYIYQNKTENFKQINYVQGPFPSYYHVKSQDVNPTKQQCVNSGLDASCINKQLEETGGDLNLALSNCGGDPVDPMDYVNAEIDQHSRDYISTASQMMSIPAKYQFTPTYEWGSRIHYQ